MVSQDPFGDDVGGAALLDAINIAVARTHLKEVSIVADSLLVRMRSNVVLQ